MSEKRTRLEIIRSYSPRTQSEKENWKEPPELWEELRRLEEEISRNHAKATGEYYRYGYDDSWGNE